MSLPHPVRMTRRRDFEAVRLRGVSVGGKLLALGVMSGHSSKRTLAGVIAPKALGTAPVRNRIKRRLREIIRGALPVLEAAAGNPPVFVTIARRGSVAATFGELEAEWHRLARMAGLGPVAARSQSPQPAGPPPGP